MKIILFSITGILLLGLGVLAIMVAQERPGGGFHLARKQQRIVIDRIISGGAAQKAGMKKNDQLLAMNGHPVHTGHEVDAYFLQGRIGELITFKILRNGIEREITLRLGKEYTSRFIIINVVLGFIFWIMGVFVYLKKPDEKEARVFAWAAVLLGTSILMIWEGYPYSMRVLTYLTIIVYNIIYTLMPATILYFTLLYPEEKPFLRKSSFIPFVIFLPCFVFMLFRCWSYLRVVDFYSSIRFIQYIYVDNALRAFLVIYLLLSIYSLIDAYRRAETKENRDRVLWIFFGLTIGTIPFVYLWTLPRILGFPQLISDDIAYGFMILTPVTIAFSIIKYRVLDIEIIINRSIVYVLLTGIIVALYLSIVGVTGYLMQSISSRTNNLIAIVCTLIAAALFTPLRRRLQIFVDKTFYREKYNYQIVIKNYSKAITTAQTQDELMGLLINNILSVIPADRLILMVEDPSGETFSVGAARGLEMDLRSRFIIEKESAIVRSIKTASSPMKKYIRNKLEPYEKLPDDERLENLGIKLLIPVFIEEELKGILLLSEKMSGVRYSENDLDLIIPMTEECLMALERIRMQQNMILERAEKEKHEELSRLKSEFISHVSHELRTPLTSTRWILENMLDGIPEKPGQALITYIQSMHSNSIYLGKMIDNLLDANRIESGRTVIHPQELDIKQELNKCLVRLRPLADKKSIRYDTADVQALSFFADPDALQTILSNLIENAIKYTNESDIIKIRSEKIVPESGAESSDREELTVSITDHGPGIPAEKIDTIFQRFERVRDGSGSREKGLGLGLYIVKQLVESHGGSIRVKSKQGEGATFVFAIPVQSKIER